MYYVTTTFGTTWHGLTSEMIEGYQYDNLEYFDTISEVYEEIKRRQY